MGMGPLLKYLSSVGHYLSGIFARQQDAPSVRGVYFRAAGSQLRVIESDAIAAVLALVAVCLLSGDERK